MQHTENLHLNLPDDNDPLEVSKLSENFEILDTRIGSGTQSIVASMSVGDITYSTRNLEEESGGVLMACDQRTIDIDAYPDLPRNVLFWPLLDHIFTYSDDTNIYGDNAYYSQYAGINRDASTNKFIYVNGGGVIASNAGSYTFVYSVDEKKIYAVTTIPATTPLVRIAPDKIVPLNGNRSIYNNVLAATGSQLSVGAAKVIGTSSGQITRLGPSSFFIVSFQGSSETYPMGFYKTDDGFSTIQQITNASTFENISATTFDQLDSALRTGALYKSPFFPIQKKTNGEVIVCFKGSSTSATYTSSSEIGTRQNIRNMLPTIWETSGGISTIASRKLGGQALEDWIWSKMVEHNALNVTTNLYAPINGEYYFLVFQVSYKISQSAYYTTYAAVVNIETEELFTNTVSRNFPNAGSTATQFFVYDKHKKRLTILKNTSVSKAVSIVDIPTKTITEDAIMFGGFDITPSAPVNYMDNAIAIQLSGGSSCITPIDKRTFDRGSPIRTPYALVLLDKEINKLSAFSGMNTMGIYTATNSGDSSDPGITFSSGISAGGNDKCGSNLVEVDGDIYVPRQRSLYKLSKNKRQMPYIKNGYMKVLNEPAEGGAE